MSDDMREHGPIASPEPGEAVAPDEADLSAEHHADPLAGADGPDVESTPTVPAATRVSILLLAAGLFALWIGFGATAASHTQVPTVTGLMPAQVRVSLERASVRAGVRRRVATSAFESGAVVAQAPPFGTRVDVGSAVDMSVAVAPTSTVVPDLTLDYEQVAEATLGRALLVPLVYTQLSDTVPFGRVVSQMPRPNQPVVTGSKVVVFVSGGPGSAGVPVPNVVGMKANDARVVVANVYLIPTWPSLPPDTPPSGTVVDQQPAPGSRVPVGSSVPLAFSTN